MKLITVITFYAVAVASRLDPVLWLLGRDNFFKFHFISGWERVEEGWDFSLSLEDLALIDKLDKGQENQNTMAGWLREHDPDFYL